jgi:hypothetical protein
MFGLPLPRHTSTLPILGLILAVALPPEAARGMLLGLLQTIGHLYGLPELPMLPC